MKRIVCILITLLLSAQLDDAWAVVGVGPSAPVEGDSDEYPAAQRLDRGAKSTCRQVPAFAGWQPRASGRCVAPGAVQCERNPSNPLPPSLLLMFTSLQL